MQLLKLLLYTFVLPALAIETMQDPLSKQEPLPEQLFLDYRISDVLDESIRIPKVDPWASEYCAAITEKRYGDAIWARYHMSGNAIDGVITYLGELDDGSCGEYKVNVYDEIMEDAYGYALSSSDCYREALEFYSHSSPRDSRRDILEGLAMVKVSMMARVRSSLSMWYEEHIESWL